MDTQLLLSKENTAEAFEILRDQYQDKIDEQLQSYKSIYAQIFALFIVAEIDRRLDNEAQNATGQGLGQVAALLAKAQSCKTSAEHWQRRLDTLAQIYDNPDHLMATVNAFKA
jgi:hypothetical protein